MIPVVYFRVTVCNKCAVNTERLDIVITPGPGTAVRLCTNVITNWSVYRNVSRYTLLGGVYNEIAPYIEIIENPTMQETIDFHSEVEQILGLDEHTLGRLANLISTSSTITYHGHSFVKDVRLKPGCHVVGIHLFAPR